MENNFISYSSFDALDFAFRLYDSLLAGPTSIPVWLDKREIKPGQDWDKEIVEAIRICDSMIFVMTHDSVEDESVCKLEWTRALKYKKAIVPILFQSGAEMPFRLGSRQYIDFTGDFDTGLAQLRLHLRWLASPDGILQSLKDRLEDDKRDLRRARDPDQETRIQNEIALLKKQIKDQQRIIDDPEGAVKRVEESITRGIEQERQPEKPISGVTRTRFINPPPAIAPTYFQDMHVETNHIGNFLKNDALCLMTLVGRAGFGKTAMVCRLLKSLEGGRLPDDGEKLSIDGIVYLSEMGTRQVTVPNLYADLSCLLPEDVSKKLDEVYRNPETSTGEKMQLLLEAFPSGRVILLLDNFENLIDPMTRNITSAEMDEALRSVLNLPPHAVKVILTTRIAPRDMALMHPERQFRIDLEKGLEFPYAENILRKMDVDGTVGLKDASDELLKEARERTLGNPRALEALFAILSADRDTTLKEILNDKRLLPENVVEVLVGEAFSRLDRTAQIVMKALAVYGHPVTPSAIDYMLKPHLPSVDSAPVLKRLVNMKFVRKVNDSYYMHPVDREYALSRVDEGVESKRDEPVFTQFSLLHRGADYYKQLRTQRDNWKTIDDLNPQLTEFKLRCMGKDYDTAAGVLLEIDSDYLQKWGHFRLLIEHHERLAGKLSNPKCTMESSSNLGYAYHYVGNYEKAIKCYDDAMEIARKIKDRKCEGVQLGKKGNVYRVRGEVGISIKCYEKALTIANETNDRRNKGIWLGNLGISYRLNGDLKKAIKSLDRALEIARDKKDKQYESRWLTNIGLVHRDLSHSNPSQIDTSEIYEAIECYSEALKIAQDIRDKRNEGFLFGEFGYAYRSLDEKEKAIKYYKNALKIAKVIRDRSNENKWLGGLGKICHDLGDIKNAIKYYKIALRIAQEIGNKRFERRWLNDLAEVFENEKKYKEALVFLILARDISTRVEDKSLKEIESKIEKLQEKLSKREYDKLKAEVAANPNEIVRRILEQPI